MGRLQEKVVVVTGAGRGIGRAYARAMAAEGARVVVNDLGVEVTGGKPRADTAEAVVSEIRAAGGGKCVLSEELRECEGPEASKGSREKRSTVECKVAHVFC